jgi:hypothetical protein
VGEAEPAVGDPCHPVERLGGHAAEQQRRAARLDRTRPDRQVGAVVAVGRHAVGEGAAQVGDALLHAAAAGRPVQPVGVELVLDVAVAEPEQEPAAGHQVDHAGLLGDVAGPVQGQQQHAGAEAEAAGARRHRRQEGELLGEVAVAVAVVLAAPDGAEAELLDQLRLFQALGVVGGVRLAALAGPQLHPRSEGR